jgi:hypothetical protein
MMSVAVCHPRELGRLGAINKKWFGRGCKRNASAFGASWTFGESLLHAFAACCVFSAKD